MSNCGIVEQYKSFAGTKIAYRDSRNIDKVFLFADAEIDADTVIPNVKKCMATRLRTLSRSTTHQVVFGGEK